MERVFSKIGTAEIATDPMPPSVADTFVILKPPAEWPGPHRTKPELVAAMEQACEEVPGNNYEFTQPIQMRSMSCFPVCRADVAVKVFGDDMDTLLAVGEQIEGIIETIPGAADVKTEQDHRVAGAFHSDGSGENGALWFERGGCSGCGIHFCGRKATGTIYEGDRRFELQVRLPEQQRGDVEALKRLPIRIPAASASTGAGTAVNPALPAYVALGEVANFVVCAGPQSGQPRKRRTQSRLVTANVRGRNFGSFVKTRQKHLSLSKSDIPPGTWVTWGGQFEQLISAAQRLQS